MKPLRLPDGKLVNLDDVRSAVVSGTSIVFTHPDTSTMSYDAGSSAAAEDLLDQVERIASAAPGAPTTSLVQLVTTRTITSVSPTSMSGSGAGALTINGTNMIDQVMIDNGELQVTVNGVGAGVVSSTPSQIVVTLPTVTAGTATININRVPYGYSTGVLLCTDNTLLTIT